MIGFLKKFGAFGQQLFRFVPGQGIDQRVTRVLHLRLEDVVEQPIV